MKMHWFALNGAGLIRRTEGMLMLVSIFGYCYWVVLENGCKTVVVVIGLETSCKFLAARPLRPVGF